MEEFHVSMVFVREGAIDTRQKVQILVIERNKVCLERRIEM